MIRLSGGDTGRDANRRGKADAATGTNRGKREIVMARFEISNLESVVSGQGPLAADIFYDLGIRYAVGNSVPADLVSAHKWFNLAAMKGNREAVAQRQEIAANMSPAEIAAALRAARAWLTSH
jgi:TPR repeat protein